MDPAEDCGEGGVMDMTAPIDSIHIGERHRDLDDVKVKELAESISKIGLLHPPAVYLKDGVIVDGVTSDQVPVLIYGRHRLAALKLNGETSVKFIVHDVDDIRAELMEIAENLHRAELTALQRDEQVGRWIELTVAKQEAISSQVATKPGRPQSGINAAARELGISKDDAHRAVKVASLSPEAKAAAVEAGLDNNRSVLLEAAKAHTAVAQAEAIVARARADDIRKRQDNPEEAKRIRERDEREQKELDAFMASVKAAESLLVELEDDGPDEQHIGGANESYKTAYADLTYLQFAERYKPVVALRAYRWDIGHGGLARDTSRRVNSAQGFVRQMMQDKAEAETEKVAA